jgi:hypothetical protein
VIEVEGSSDPDASVEQYLEDEYRGWAEMTEDNPEEAVSFELPLAPDRLTKANISGGVYRMPLPDGTAEGLIVGDVAMPFVSYLNWVFRNGGFPGPAVGDAQWRIRRDLAMGMLEL